MTKKIAKVYRLLDESGTIWAESSLSNTRLNALVREYKRHNIHLLIKEIA